MSILSVTILLTLYSKNKGLRKLPPHPHYRTTPQIYINIYMRPSEISFGEVWSYRSVLESRIYQLFSSSWHESLMRCVYLPSPLPGQYLVYVCVCVGGIHTLGSLKCKVTSLFNFWMWNIYLGKSAALGEQGRKRREKRDKLKQISKDPLMNCIKIVCLCYVTYVVYSFSLPELF